MENPHTPTDRLKTRDEIQKALLKFPQSWEELSQYRFEGQKFMKNWKSGSVPSCQYITGNSEFIK